jgi:hypothetical protein
MARRLMSTRHAAASLADRRNGNGCIVGREEVGKAGDGVHVRQPVASSKMGATLGSVVSQRQRSEAD